MEILKFKTNIADQESVNKVGNLLDQQEGISKWNIDPNSEENVLSISGDNVNPQKIKNIVQEAGFQAEIIRVVGIGGGNL